MPEEDVLVLEIFDTNLLDLKIDTMNQKIIINKEKGQSFPDVIKIHKKRINFLCRRCLHPLKISRITDTYDKQAGINVEIEPCERCIGDELVEGLKKENKKLEENITQLNQENIKLEKDLKDLDESIKGLGARRREIVSSINNLNDLQKYIISRDVLISSTTKKRIDEISEIIRTLNKLQSDIDLYKNYD